MDTFQAMKIVSLLILMLCVERNSFTAASGGDEVSYKDLVKLNFSCFPMDSCEGRKGSSYDEFPHVICSCEKSCSAVDACCIDSPHRDLYPVFPHSCRSVGHECNPPNKFYMVDRCEFDGESDPPWQELCEGEKQDDILKIAPVTSLSTSITYKNYFCFKCEETTDDFFYWNVRFANYTNSFVDSESTVILYDRFEESWVAVDGNGTTLAVKFGFEIPERERNLAIPCASNVISKCILNWTYEIDRILCSGYSAIVDSRKDWGYQSYKNMHCAICNYESVENMGCSVGLWMDCFSAYPFEKLIDLNGFREKCNSSYEWDPLAKRCREFYQDT